MRGMTLTPVMLKVLWRVFIFTPYVGNPFSRGRTASIRLAESPADEKYRKFKSRFMSFNPRKVREWFGLGGSREITWTKFKIGKDVITIQEEPRAGVYLHGKKEVLDRLVEPIK